MLFTSIDRRDPESNDRGNAAELLAGVLHSAMDAIITVDGQQRIVAYNHAAEEIFGWPSLEVVGQPLEKLIPVHFRQAHAQHVERYGNTGVSSRRMGINRVVYGLRRNGEEFPLDASISLLDTPQGKLFTVIIRDVTEMHRLQHEQARNEAQLRESHRRLQVAQRVARIAYWQIDLATQRMWWCDEAHHMMGLERAMLNGTFNEFLQRIHPDDRQAFVLERDAAVLAGMPLEAEFRVITSCDKVRWIQLLGWVEDNGSDDITHRRTGIVREITNRKRSEQVITRQVDLLNRTGALARVGGWEMDMQTKAPYYSEEIYHIHELDASMGGTGLEDPVSFYAPEAQPVVKAAIKAALQNATPWDLELPLITAKGQQIWVRTQGRATLENGKVVRLFGVLQDITEIKVTEMALRLSNQELQAFSYSVSHDLRSPLSTISGYSNLLAKDLAGNASEKAQRYLASIQASAAQIEQTIEVLLALAQVSQTLMRSETVDLSLMARSILDERQAREPERQVTTHIESGLQAYGDARLLRVVMENLLENAWKFSSQKIQAQIRVGQQSEPGKPPVFFVRDNGIGFDMAYADQLFKPFQRLHAVSEFPGTGIGLTTVSRVIRRQGGKIWAESTPGCGASFYFTLPS
ncbi:PAS domain S-box protein [Polaromonas sp. DSR2-3-2]|uniref:PAS domain S-box protein n=1 Tax=unclassified Polaromonas TaxID=2638319 RepID=UPI003CF3E0B9